jgi:hypothetical protein
MLTSTVTNYRVKKFHESNQCFAHVLPILFVMCELYKSIITPEFETIFLGGSGVGFSFLRVNSWLFMRVILLSFAFQNRQKVIYRKFYNTYTLHLEKIRDMVVDIATRHKLDGPGIESRWRKFFAPLHTDPEAHPASHTMGTGSVFQGIKRPRRGVDHPPPLEPS